MDPHIIVRGRRQHRCRMSVLSGISPAARPFRGLDTFRKGPNGIEVIMFSNSIATIGLMRTVSKSGDRSAQAKPENVAARRGRRHRSRPHRDFCDIFIGSYWHFSANRAQGRQSLELPP
jgi:hypothetical protein